jgi:hypothetical protein
VAKARKNAEVSGAFIRERVMALLLGAKDTAHASNREAQQRLLQERAQLKVHQSMRDISRALRSIVAAGTMLDPAACDYMNAIRLRAEAGELQKALRSAKHAVDLLYERIGP